VSGIGLSNEARVAVIGGGVSGSALACSLIQNARTRGRTVQVRVYDGGGAERRMPPAVLTPECRSRLAGLGCRIPVEWRALELRGIEIIAGSERETLPAPSGGLWVVDRWTVGLPGQRLLSQALAGVAAAGDARFIARRVDRVERQPLVAGVHNLAKNPGELVVRAEGGAERFHAVALAAGASSELRGAFFDGFCGPPTLPAAHARLRHGPVRTFGGQSAKLWLSPLPGVDGLLLLPAQGSTYALAFGPTTTPADLCQAVMAALRDGLLPEGIEISELSVTRVPSGAGTQLTAPGQLAVGAAASGHPLQLGVSEALASATRGALALVDAGLDGAALERRYVRETMLELLEDANHGARALGWLRRAGARAPRAMVRARESTRPATPFSGGVLGLPSPTPSALLARARLAAIGEALVRVFLLAREPLVPSAVVPEPDLYYVVDDDPAAREALAEYLEQQGAHVVAFGDELSLFSAVARRPPTAILLDVVLNWVDGLRLCEGLKQHPLTRAVPVYVISGLNRPHVRARALAAGAEAFLPKPIEPERVIHLVRAHRQSVAAAGPSEPRVESDVIAS